MPEKKDYVSMSKEVHKQNFSTCQSLCNLQESYNTFKEKRPNVNIGFSKFYVLRPKSCVVAGSKITHSACVCSAHQNVVATRYIGLGLNIQRLDQEDGLQP